MRKAVVLAGLMSVVLGSAREAFGNNRTDDPLGIAVSPQALILGVEQSGRVTVHTDIPGSAVDRATVALNGIPASSTWVDLRGNLVAGFGEADVKAIVEPDEATLTLTGNRLDGTAMLSSASWPGTFWHCAGGVRAGRYTDARSGESNGHFSSQNGHPRAPDQHRLDILPWSQHLNSSSPGSIHPVALLSDEPWHLNQTISPHV